MKCDAILNLLDDFIDGELDMLRQEQVREHLEQCASCSTEHRATLELLQRVKAMPLDEEPPRDLWGGIHHRIEAPVSGNGSSRGRLVLIAAAAVLVLAVVVGPGLLDPAGSPLEPVSYQEADDRFAEVREQLLAGLTSGEDRLNPEMVRVVRKNLQVMDDAAAEIRKALAADPDNSGLRRMLLASYRQQAKLLTRVREYPDAI